MDIFLLATLLSIKGFPGEGQGKIATRLHRSSGGPSCSTENWSTENSTAWKYGFAQCHGMPLTVVTNRWEASTNWEVKSNYFASRDGKQEAPEKQQPTTFQAVMAFQANYPSRDGVPKAYPQQKHVMVSLFQLLLQRL